MTELILWVSCFILIGLLFWDPTRIGEFAANHVFSYYSIFIIFILLIICVTHIIIHFIHAKKLGIFIVQIILFPSTLVPLLTIFSYCIPISWSILDKEYIITLVNKNYLDMTVIIIVLSSIFLLTGLTVGKYIILSNISKSYSKKNLLKRKFDFLFLNLKNQNLSLYLIIISILISPFQLGLRTDVIVEGGRGFSVNSSLLQVLIPLAGIISTICTILAGIYYSYLKKPVIFIIPLMDALPRLVTLSRGFFLPLILFVCSSSLLGKAFPKWVYFSIIPCSLIFGATALVARGLSSGGVYGLASGFHQTQLDTLSLIRVFFEANSDIGILSNAVAFHNPSQNFIDGLLAWLVTILPIPSFLGIKASIPDVAGLLHITSVGIPMPVVGELYFQMGWLGLSIFFFLGLWLGRLEGNIILHTKLYGRAYWPHVLIWLSLLYSFILSFHSASRGSSRTLIYSVFLMGVLQAIYPFIRKK